MMRRAWLLVVLAACGGGRARPEYPTPDDEAGAGAAARAPAPRRAIAGEVERARLDELCAAGPGALLARVRIQAVAQGGKFHGWRILSLPPEPPVELRAGDVVLRVNGRGLERPEDLSRVFAALRAATEIVVDYERDGEPRSWRLAVVER